MTVLYVPQPQSRILGIAASMPLTLLILAGMFLALLVGAVAALGNLYVILGIFALIGGIAVIATPVVATIWLLYFASFLIVGPVIYFTGFTQVQWLPPVLGAVLLLPVLAQVMGGSARNTPAAPLPMFLVFLVAFFIVAIFGTLIVRPDIDEGLFRAARWYLFLWPVMLAFMLGAVQPDTLQRLWHFLLIVVVLQPPMALYQYLIVTKRSVRDSPSDAVVGTFPGSEFTGGQSAAMGMAILIGTLTAIALWRAGRLKGLYASVICLAGLLTLALAEVKAVVLLMPLVLAFYFGREIVRHLWTSLLVGLGVVALLLLILTGYQYLHYIPDGTDVTASEKIQSALDPEKEVASTGELGRVAHLVLWWSQNVHSGKLQHTLLGFGMGATQSTGEIQRKYPSYDMAASSSTILLWETGLIGHLLFVLVLLAAAELSARKSRSAVVPDVHRILLRVGAVGLVLLAITLPYKAMAFNSIQIQLLLMLMLGQAAYWNIHASVQGPPGVGRAFKRSNL